MRKRILPGLLACLCLATGMSACDGGLTSSAGSTSPTPDTRDTAAIAYLALGDSYTIGEGVAAPERWPMQLAAMARTAGIPLSNPRIIARTGWTTGDLAGALDAENPQGPFGLVSLLIGVNNQYRGMPLEDYRIGCESLLRRAIELAGGRPDRVLVLSIPDWGASFYGLRYDPGTIAKEIDAFNGENQALAIAYGTRYVDVTPVSRAAAGDESMFASDGLHPSGLMYSAWAELAVSRLGSSRKY